MYLYLYLRFCFSLKSTRQVAAHTGKRTGAAVKTENDSKKAKKEKATSSSAADDVDRRPLAPFADAPKWFRPNLTPAQMVARGMHGGM
jgi:hypothetical protein